MTAETKRQRILVSLLLAVPGLLLAAPVFADTCHDALQQGEELFKAEKYDEAILAFSRAAQAGDPEAAKVALAWLGDCYSNKEDVEQAIAWYERALEKDAKYLWVLQRLANLHFIKPSYYARGFSLAERAEALFSADPGVYYNMACYYALKRNVDLAIRYLDRAIYHGYDDLAHLSADTDFEAIKSIEPFKHLMGHPDSIAVGRRLLDQAVQKSKSGACREALRRLSLLRFKALTYSAVVLSEVSGALKGSSEEDGYLTVEEVQCE
jgi:tetratricopeptide (TPR) repeat protein